MWKNYFKTKPLYTVFKREKGQETKNKTEKPKQQQQQKTEPHPNKQKVSYNPLFFQCVFQSDFSTVFETLNELKITSLPFLNIATSPSTASAWEPVQNIQILTENFEKKNAKIPRAILFQTKLSAGANQFISLYL